MMPADGQHLRCATARFAANNALRWSLWVVVAWWLLRAGLARPHHMGSAQDWAYFNQHATASWLSWTVYGEVPQWNPWSCGGIVALGNLQASPVGFTQLLALFFGPVAGQRLAAFLFVLAGLEGGYRYAVHRGVLGVGAVATGVLFGVSGRFVQLFLDGQPAFVCLELAPWALLCLERGWLTWRWAIGGGFVMALLFLEGGAVPTPLVGVVLLVMTLARTGLWGLRALGSSPTTDDLKVWRPVAALGVMAAVAVGLTLFRVLPVVETLLESPRVWPTTDAYPIGDIIDMVLRAGPVPGYHADGSSLIGINAAYLFVFALLLRDRRMAWPLAMAVLMADLATGSREGLGTFAFIKQLPVLENMRNPFRFSLFFGLFLAVGAGCGLSLLEDRLLRFADHMADRVGLPGQGVERQSVRAVGFFIAVSAAFVPCWQLLQFGHERLADVFVREAPQLADQPFRQSIGNRWAADVWPAMNRGSLSCFEEQPFFQAKGLRGDREREEFVDPPGAGTVTRVSWTPHRIELRVELDRPADVVINQNYHRGWTASVGEVRRRADGLLVVAMPAGENVVLARFSDPLVWFGVFGSVVTLLGLCVLWWRRASDSR